MRLLAEIKALQLAENEQYGNTDLPTHQSDEEIQVVLKSEDLHQHLRHLNALILREGEKNRKRRYATIGRHLVKEQTNLEKYEEQEAILGNRNSYARTEEDATGLRMKDDRLLPGYNVQITTSNQYILNASIHQNGSDNPTLKPHLEKLEQRFDSLVEDQVLDPQWKDSATADAGYGSEENYQLLQDKGFEAYVKYPWWYKEYKGQMKKYPFHFYNWIYDSEGDYYLCPNDQKLSFREETTRTTATGYERHFRVYEAQSCQGCPLWEDCRNSKAKTRVKTEPSGEVSSWSNLPERQKSD